jgi:hypothetical protein
MHLVWHIGAEGAGLLRLFKMGFLYADRDGGPYSWQLRFWRKSPLARELEKQTWVYAHPSLPEWPT